MKKFFMISILMGAMPLSMVAQDDLYFVPKKKSAEVVEVTTPINNRVKSRYEVIQNDSTNDIIEFDGQKGIYPDSLTEDFELTKKMQRFEDYDLSDNAAFWAGYHLGRDTWDWGLSWHSPWYYRTYGWYGGWYDPWYYTSWRYGWYDPWLDPWHYGYYDPWYYSWYGIYDPWYYGYYGLYDRWRYGYYGYYSLGYPYYADVYYGGGAPRRYSTNRVSGTQNHGRIDYSGPRGVSNGRTTIHSAGTFGGSSIGGSRTSTRVTAQDNNQRTVVRNASGNFGGSRSATYSNSGSSTSRSTGSYSNSSSNSSRSTGSFSNSSSRGSSVSSSSSSGGSFGGSRSGGGSVGGGGGSRGGGGSFGGGRR